MLFNSLHFVVFFILVTTTYFLIPHKFRWQLLLAASCYFYMVFMPVYILILGFTIVVDYFVGIWLEDTSDRKRKKWILVLSLIANIGVLAFFKYYNFLNDNLSILLNVWGYENEVPRLGILLPIGLSFHTFQAMSYTIEVYRGRYPAERHFGIYSLYVMYYPQLVAGPIERPQNVLPQYHAKQHFDYDRVTSGLRLMAWGFFKKVVIADRISPMVDHVYGNPEAFTGFSLIAATILFAFQIYTDFSGYSDIAIGCSRIMGIRLMDNFREPYFATSLNEFWGRWHISLSTWFRDYLYIPMGGRRVKVNRHFFNIFITFLISGIWHGANWTFVIWGSLHGIFLIAETIVKRLKPDVNKTSLVQRILKQVWVFSLVCITWVFFRAESVSEAWHIVTHMTVNLGESFTVFLTQKLGADFYDWVIVASSVGIMLLVEFKKQTTVISQWILSMPKTLRWSVYLLLIFYIISFGQFEYFRQFIYFQF